MEKTSEMQSPRVVNVQSSPREREAGADSGPAWAVARQVEKRSREIQMPRGWSREREEFGKRVTLSFQRERGGRNRSAVVCQGLAISKRVYLR